MHRSIEAIVGAYHPNFLKLIDILKGEQNLNQVIAQARAGHPREPRRRPDVIRTATNVTYHEVMPTIHYFINPCLTFLLFKDKTEISFRKLILKTKSSKIFKKNSLSGQLLSRGFMSEEFLSQGLFCPRSNHGT